MASYVYFERTTKNEQNGVGSETCAMMYRTIAEHHIGDRDTNDMLSHLLEKSSIMACGVTEHVERFSRNEAAI